MTCRYAENLFSSNMISSKMWMKTNELSKRYLFYITKKKYS